MNDYCIVLGWRIRGPHAKLGTGEVFNNIEKTEFLISHAWIVCIVFIKILMVKDEKNWSSRAENCSLNRTYCHPGIVYAN